MPHSQVQAASPQAHTPAAAGVRQASIRLPSSPCISCPCRPLWAAQDGKRSRQGRSMSPLLLDVPGVCSGAQQGTCNDAPWRISTDARFACSVHRAEVCPSTPGPRPRGTMRLSPWANRCPQGRPSLWPEEPANAPAAARAVSTVAAAGTKTTRTPALPPCHRGPRPPGRGKEIAQVLVFRRLARADSGNVISESGEKLSTPTRYIRVSRHLHCEMRDEMFIEKLQRNVYWHYIH